MKFFRPLSFTVLLVACASLTPGCGPSSPTVSESPTDDLPGLPDESALAPPANQIPARLPSATSNQSMKNSENGNRGTALVQQPLAETNPQQTESQQTESLQTESENPSGLLPLATTDPTGETPDIGLKQDLTPEQLVDFLAKADQDMQTVASGASGISDPREARKTLLQIIHLKKEAARRLAEDQTLAEPMRTEGQRGQLQALSHLAALGDLKAADELRELAEANIQTGNAKVVSDSRLVLIGFAIEDLQNGAKDAPTQIVALVRDLSRETQQNDVPAMMVMGQARQILANYGHDDEARLVRDTIIDLYAGSSDPQVAKMASQLAGNVRFDGINQLIDNIHDDQAVSPDQWIESAETLIDESADMQTVQYLAGAALDLESRDQTELAEATYDVLQRRFTDRESATFQEVELAIEAHDARTGAIGKEFDFSLPSVQGDAISMLDYRGKVVLMAFWTMDFTQSLQIVPMLEEIRDTSPDNIVIIGMNLDSDADEVRAFVEKNNLDFPHFRAASSADQSVGNPAAAQFGVVSLPCVVVFDQKGRATEIDFSGRKLEKAVKELLP